MQRLGECNGCGVCCRFLVFQVNPAYLEPDRRKWIEMHGIRLYEQGGAVWATVDSPCRHLTEDNRCAIFGSPDRPETCERFPFSQGDIDLVNAWVGDNVCSYEFVEA